MLFIVVISLVLLAKPEAPQTPNIQENSTVSPGYYMITAIVDGDTIKVDINGKTESVRLIGIDSAELPDECFSLEAKLKAQEILQGQQIELEKDKTQDNRDHYGRLLRYVVLKDGTNFNRLMIAKGYAKEFTFITPYKFQSEFKKAQSKAKKNKLGLWAPGAC